MGAQHHLADVVNAKEGNRHRQEIRWSIHRPTREDIQQETKNEAVRAYPMIQSISRILSDRMIRLLNSKIKKEKSEQEAQFGVTAT
jgi:hypothetical protein